MNSRDFAFWVQGAIELGKIKTMDEEQVRILAAHASMVFIHELDNLFPEEQQEALNAAHEAGKTPPAEVQGDIPKSQGSNPSTQRPVEDDQEKTPSAGVKITEERLRELIESTKRAIEEGEVKFPEPKRRGIFPDNSGDIIIRC